jgi:hypothetical protein
VNQIVRSRITSSLAPLGGVALLGLASLLPLAVPEWFAPPPERVNFLASGAPLLLAPGVMLRLRWPWRLAQGVALLAACVALGYGLLGARDYLRGWAGLAVLSAAAFTLLRRQAPW